MRADGRAHGIRPKRGRVFLAVAIVVGAMMTSGAAADDVAEFLARNSLNGLLAAHLEMRLETATPTERAEILERLVDLYARRLEETKDDELRREIEERSRQLLAEAPRDSTYRLRLALLRASFRPLEQFVELSRLTPPEPGTVAKTLEGFERLERDLSNLRGDLHDRWETSMRRLGRATGANAIVLAESADRTRNLEQQAMFLLAWSTYYQAWLHPDPRLARRAEKIFIELLELGDDLPVPENVSVDLRSVEAIARSILGVALCRSVVGETVEAQDWLELLAHDRAFGPLRKQVPVWRLIILLEGDDFIEARGAFADLTGRGEDVPVAWLRIAAIASLERLSRSRLASELARDVVTELAARGELDHVFELAERYGVDALGSSGFALSYVRGALLYRSARTEHGDAEPTSRAELHVAYDRASDQLEMARRARDAESYPAARADCGRLMAWCDFLSGDFSDARARFLESERDLAAPASAEALWMAIVCADRLAGGSTNVQPETEAMIERFLTTYPGHEHVATLVLRQASRPGAATMDTVEALLGVPPQSEAYGQARVRAGQLLYELFRNAGPRTRSAIGAKFLAVTAPRFREECASFRSETETKAAALLARGRQILEVALHESVRAAEIARSTLESFDELEENGFDLSPLTIELEYRRLRLALLHGDVGLAASIADARFAAGVDATWTPLMARALFLDARRQWQSEGAAADVVLIDRVIRYGEQVLDDAAAPGGESRLAVSAVVAEASMALWEKTGNRDHGRRALERLERLREDRPRDARFLRMTAILSTEFDAPEQALGCSRRLVAGLPEDDERWFEARFNVVSILAPNDAARALRILDQHAQLHPDYGPEPWGARLRGLHARLRGSGGGAP